MAKKRVVVLYGGRADEHSISCISTAGVLGAMDTERFEPIPVGITKDGKWIINGEDPRGWNLDGGELPTVKITPESRPVMLDPSRGQDGFFIGEPSHINSADSGFGTSFVSMSDPEMHHVLTSLGHVDAVLPVLHGPYGEDGTVQGLLEMMGVPYVGCGVFASAACMDKTTTKLIADAAGVRQAAWQLVTREGFARSREAALSAVEARFAYPVFVKPAGTGSSVGVAKAKDRAALETAIEAALKYDRKVLVEEFIRGQEVEVAVLGNDNPFASVCGEIDSGAEFYDYDAKYISDCAHLYIPARISEQTAEQVRELAVRVYRAMGCRGLSRVDFFVKADGEVVFNEINTIPGFTSISMYPKLFEASGIPYGELLDDLIALALEA